MVSGFRFVNQKLSNAEATILIRKIVAFFIFFSFKMLTFSVPIEQNVIVSGKWEETCGDSNPRLSGSAAMRLTTTWRRYNRFCLKGLNIFYWLLAVSMSLVRATEIPSESMMTSDWPGWKSLCSTRCTNNDIQAHSQTCPNWVQAIQSPIFRLLQVHPIHYGFLKIWLHLVATSVTWSTWPTCDPTIELRRT